MKHVGYVALGLTVPVLFFTLLVKSFIFAVTTLVLGGLLVAYGIGRLLVSFVAAVILVNR